MPKLTYMIVKVFIFDAVIFFLCVEICNHLKRFPCLLVICTEAPLFSTLKVLHYEGILRCFCDDILQGI
jgi:hypothetical protein